MAFGIAARANFRGGRDIDLAEGGIRNAAGGVAIVLCRRDGSDDGDMAVARKVRRDLGEATDVLAAVLRREAEIAVEAGAQRIAVEQDRRAAIAEQAALQR